MSTTAVSANRLELLQIADAVAREKSIDAEIVVFVGSSKPNYSDIKCSYIYRSHKKKSVIFEAGDAGIPLIPGLG